MAPPLLFSRGINNILVNNESVNNKIKEEIKRYIETNESENTTTQNLWDTVKVVLKEKSIALQAYFKKEDKSHTNLTLKGTGKKKNNKQSPE